jgi:aerobic carbon-monoxide dehydrogenase small subunit
MCKMKQRYAFTVNGRGRETEAEPHESLLDVLRENLRLTGTKKGCNEAECGSCTVLLNGRPVVSCLVLVPDAAGQDVVTIEALSTDGKPHPVQQRMVDGGGVQCGYCTPGMIMSAYALLEENPEPSHEEIRFAISGNICRCTGYGKIVKAVSAAATDLKQGREWNEAK